MIVCVLPHIRQVNVTSTRTLSMVDHYSRWNRDDTQVEDAYRITELRYGDGPSEVTPAPPTSKDVPTLIGKMQKKLDKLKKKEAKEEEKD